MSALLFPGQGSQRVGMGADLYQESAAARAIFEEAEALSELPLRRLCFEGPDDALRATEVAQPALLATELAALAALAERAGADAGAGGAISVLDVGWIAGHSLGEYAACVAAGSLSTADGIRLASARGRLMARAPEGAMAAVLGLDVERLRDVCRSVAGVVVVANDNAPGQVVLSGEAVAVVAAGDAARAAGAARVIPLNVSGAFHSPLMQGAADEFSAHVDQVALKDLLVPIVGNVSAEPISDAEALRTELRRQLISPVRWRETMLWLAAAGAGRAVECGPGNVLAGLARRATPGLRVDALGSVRDVATLVTSGG